MCFHGQDDLTITKVVVPLPLKLQLFQRFVWKQAKTRGSGELTINKSLTIKGSDLILGSDDGRHTGTTPQNRALVHGNSDQLHKLCWGGVVVHGRGLVAKEICVKKV